MVTGRLQNRVHNGRRTGGSLLACLHRQRLCGRRVLPAGFAGIQPPASDGGGRRADQLHQSRLVSGRLPVSRLPAGWSLVHSGAEDQGDEFTANEIREALSFKLEDKLTVEQPELKQPSTIGRFTIEVQ